MSNSVPLEDAMCGSESHAFNEVVRDRIESLYHSHYGRTGKYLADTVREFCDW